MIDQGVVLALQRTVEPQSSLQKGPALVIEPVEDKDNETSEEALEPKEEAMEEESPPATYAVHVLAGYSNPQMIKVGGFLKQQLITIVIDMGNTNNFLNSKVAAHLELQIECCNKFDVKVADGRIFNCDQRCPRVKLLLQDQEVVADFFLLPIDDYEVILGIEWLTTLGDISWNFSKLIMKFYCKGRQVTLRGKRGSHISTISTQRMEKVLHKAHGRFFMHI
ncbi:hypothetical protein GW17_00047901 [Ensete ventricosum]|uniref:Uncharacterized protein n=1 Tax=Ensete ventricosum TaxID=4639 RepID=A0A444CVM0_ENSVE|nr:hypothetical protein GW17_00047901 [Ensete ventricosum]RZR74840.1 hypothetical protein BHM03_00044667 [Ensete ventricosum]